MSRVEPELAGLKLVRPPDADIPRSPGVYSWWLNTAEFPTPETADLTQLPSVRRTPHSAEKAELLYVGRARRNLHQRINSQHLRRTRSSALRRTLLAALLPGEPSWRNGAALDGRGRVLLESEPEEELTEWIQEHLLLGWARYGTKEEVDDRERHWIREHKPVLNTDGTAHRAKLIDLKRAFREGLPSRS